MTLSNVDFFNMEGYFGTFLKFVETIALNENFEANGADTRNFIYNSGSMTVAVNLPLAYNLLSKLAIWYFKKYSYNKIVRDIGSKVCPETASW